VRDDLLSRSSVVARRGHPPAAHRARRRTAPGARRPRGVRRAGPFDVLVELAELDGAALIEALRALVDLDIVVEARTDMFWFARADRRRHAPTAPRPAAALHGAPWWPALAPRSAATLARHAEGAGH
jgi:hypothetical protein